MDSGTNAGTAGAAFGKPKRKSVAKRNRGNLPENLPRIEQVVEPDSLMCPCGCGSPLSLGPMALQWRLHKIGEDRTERLDIVPAQLRVIRCPTVHVYMHEVTVRPEYACRACTDGVTQAPAPAALIEGGLATEGAMAHVPPLGDASIACRATGQQIRRPPSVIPTEPDPRPVRRQYPSQHLGRLGRRGGLPPWACRRPDGRAPEGIDKAFYALSADCCAIACRVIDETTAPVLDLGRGKTKTGYLWALARDDRGWGGDDPPGVVFFYAPDRKGKNAETFLRGFDGILQLPSRQHALHAPAG